MGGYCDMGRLYMARPPASMMMMAMTQAKTGRSRKNFDNIRRLRSIAPVRLWTVLAAPGLSFLPASKGTTFTEAPGRTFWMPSTITRSPGARPEETSHLSPMARSTVIIRCCTLPEPSTISATGFPFGSRETPCWGARIARSTTPSWTTARTYMPGRSICFGLGKTIRRMNDPVLGSTVTSENFRVPSNGYGVPSSRSSLTRARPGPPSLIRPAAMLRLSCSRLALDWVTST